MLASLLAKIDEQVDLTRRLLSDIGEDQIDWAPPIPAAQSLGFLLGHLLECLSGFCAVLYASAPERLSSFLALRDLPVNHRCSPSEARDHIAAYRQSIVQGFAALHDDDLARRLPTVFVPDGETILTLLLGNLEHLINHKHQLFTYLKLMGHSLGTPDLYRLRA